MLQEDISKGQRVEEVDVEVFTDGEWKTVAQGTTIGYKRMFRFPAVEAEKMRVTIKASRNIANICNVAAYYAKPLSDDAANQEWNNLPRESWKVISNSPLVIDRKEGFTFCIYLCTVQGGSKTRYGFQIFFLCKF